MLDIGRGCIPGGIRAARKLKPDLRLGGTGRVFAKESMNLFACSSIAAYPQPGQQAIDSAAVPLGKNTELRTPPLLTEEDHQERVAAGRLKRYVRQAVARELLPEHRIGICLRWLIPDRSTVDVWYSVEKKRAHYKNLMVCGLPWVCPVCAAKISEGRRIELAEAVKDKAIGLLLVTWTLQHDRADRLTDLLAVLNDAHQRVKRGAPWQRFCDRWGVLGAVTSLEITWGKASGWHPHKHGLFILRDPIDECDVSAVREFISDRYRRMLGKLGAYASGVYGLDVQSSKTFVTDYVGKWGLEAEVTKATVKDASSGFSPWQLLDLLADGQAWAGALFKEYMVATKGKSQLHWTRGLRDQLKMGHELTDQQLAEADNDQVSIMLASLTFGQWRHVLEQGAAGMLLEVANTGRSELVARYLQAIGVVGVYLERG